MPTLRKLHKSRSRASQSATSKVQTDFFASNTSILPESSGCSPYPTSFLQSSHNYSELTSLVEQRRLSECLQYLEKLGYTGDTALSVLSYLQGGAA